MMRQEVLTGVERRRRWSDAEKRAILSKVGVNGARVADVARGNDLTRQQLYQWRTEFRRRGETLSDETGFLPVEVAISPQPVPTPVLAASSVEIVLVNGRRLRGIDGVSPNDLAQLIRVVESA